MSAEEKNEQVAEPEKDNEDVQSKNSKNGSGKEEKEKSAWPGRILAMFMGILIGIVSVFGTLTAIGVWIGSQPVDKSVNAIGQITGTDLYGALFGETSDEDGTVVKAGILNEKYADLMLADLIGSVASAISDLSTGEASLSDFNEISPKVGEGIDGLLKNLDKYSVPLDREALMNAPFKGGDEETPSIGEYIQEALLNTPAGDLIMPFEPDLSPVIMALCYGEEGVDYTLEDGKVTMHGDAQKTTIQNLLGSDMSVVLNKIAIDSVMNVDLSDPIMRTLAYGADNRYTVNGDTVTMNQVTYTYENNTFYDDRNEAVVCTASELSYGVYELVFENETQYVQVEGNVGKAFKDEALSTPLLYKKVKIGDLQKDAMALIDGIYLKDVLNIHANSHSVLLTLAYGNGYEIVNGAIEGGEPRTIGQLRTGGEGLLNEISLSSIIGEDRENGLVMHLLYGKENVHYQIVNNQVTMLQKRIAVTSDNEVYNEYGEKLSGYTLDGATYTDANGTKYTYANANLDPIQTADDKQATLYYLWLENGEEALYHETLLGDLTTGNLISKMTDRITVGEILDEETLTSNEFLKHVENETIATLPDALGELTVQKIYGEDIYDENGELVSAWWYLLTVDGQEQVYKITELDQLITNMKNNIHYATLNRLAADGMIQFTGETLTSKLRTKLYYGSADTAYIDIQVKENGQYVSASQLYGEDTEVGELTVEQIIEYVDGIIKAMNELDSLFQNV